MITLCMQCWQWARKRLERPGPACVQPSWGVSATCTRKTAPLLSRRIFKACDLRQRGVKGGYMDGPQAWQMALAIIFAGEERTRHDKEFYISPPSRSSGSTHWLPAAPPPNTRSGRCSSSSTSSRTCRRGIRRKMSPSTSSTSCRSRCGAKDVVSRRNSSRRASISTICR